MQAVGLDEFLEDLQDKVVSDQDLLKSKIGQALPVLTVTG